MFSQQCGPAGLRQHAGLIGSRAVGSEHLAHLLQTAHGVGAPFLQLHRPGFKRLDLILQVI